MSQSLSIYALSVMATAAITARTFITTAGTVAAAAGTADGVARSDAAVGELFAADTLGTAEVIASAAIAKDAYIEVAAGGQAVTRTTGIPVAKALQAAAAAGDVIEVYLIPNAPV